MSWLWLLPLIVGIISWTKGETCSDALSCMHHIDGVRTDIRKEDLYSICSKTMKLIMCVEASMKDCQVKDIQIPGDNTAQLSDSIQQARVIYQGYCREVTPDPNMERETVERQTFQTVPTEAACSDISQCILDMTAFTDAVSNRRSHQACRLISPSVRCLQSAVSDCERNKQLSDDLLDTFKASLLDSRAKLDQFCVQTQEEPQAAYEARHEDGPSGSSKQLKADTTFLMGALASFFLVSSVVL